MAITKDQFERFLKAERTISDKCRRQLERVCSRAVETLGAGSPAWQYFQESVVELVCRYGEASAALACDLHELVRAACTESGELSRPEPFTAEPADIREEVERRTAKAMEGALAGAASDLPAALPVLGADLVKMFARATIEHNARRDKSCRGIQIVPRGDACSFCTMQAGRGLIYQDKKRGELREHYHLHCSCMPMPVFRHLPSWYDNSGHEAKYRAAREAYDKGAIPEELKERIAAEKAAKGRDYGTTNAVMAVMRWQNEGMK